MLRKKKRSKVPVPPVPVNPPVAVQPAPQIPLNQNPNMFPPASANVIRGNMTNQQYLNSKSNHTGLPPTPATSQVSMTQYLPSNPGSSKPLNSYQQPIITTYGQNLPNPRMNTTASGHAYGPNGMSNSYLNHMQNQNNSTAQITFNGRTFPKMPQSGQVPGIPSPAASPAVTPQMRDAFLAGMGSRDDAARLGMDPDRFGAYSNAGQYFHQTVDNDDGTQSIVHKNADGTFGYKGVWDQDRLNKLGVNSLDELREKRLRQRLAAKAGVSSTSNMTTDELRQKMREKRTADAEARRQSQLAKHGKGKVPAIPQTAVATPAKKAPIIPTNRPTGSISDDMEFQDNARKQMDELMADEKNERFFTSLNLNEESTVNDLLEVYRIHGSDMGDKDRKLLKRYLELQESSHDRDKLGNDRWSQNTSPMVNQREFDIAMDAIRNERYVDTSNIWNQKNKQPILTEEQNNNYDYWAF